jgi:hypothetical protein
MSDNAKLNECRRILGLHESVEEPIQEVDDDEKKKKRVIKQLDQLSQHAAAVSRAVKGGQLEVANVITSQVISMLNNIANIGLAFNNQQFYKKIKAIDPRDGLGM